MIDMLPQKLQPQNLATAAPQPAQGAANPNAASKQDLANLSEKQQYLTNSINDVKNTLRDLTVKAGAIQVNDLVI